MSMIWELQGLLDNHPGLSFETRAFLTEKIETMRVKPETLRQILEDIPVASMDVKANKIQFIKWIRCHTMLALKPAKDFVEDLLEYWENKDQGIDRDV